MFINGGTEIYVEQPRNPIHPTNPIHQKSKTQQKRNYNKNQKRRLSSMVVQHRFNKNTKKNGGSKIEIEKKRREVEEDERGVNRWTWNQSPPLTDVHWANQFVVRLFALRKATAGCYCCFREQVNVKSRPPDPSTPTAHHQINPPSIQVLFLFQVSNLFICSLSHRRSLNRAAAASTGQINPAVAVQEGWRREEGEIWWGRRREWEREGSSCGEGNGMGKWRGREGMRITSF